MKPLDFIKTRKGNVGMITEVSTGGGRHKAAVQFLGHAVTEKTAWWDNEEFEVIGNLPDLLSQNLKHAFGTGSLQPFRHKVPE